MPYIPLDRDEDEQEDQSQPNGNDLFVAPGSPGNASGGSTNVTGGKPNKPLSAKYTSLGEYMGLNQGQGKQQADRIGQGINNAASGVSEQLGTQQGNFDYALNAGSSTFNPNASKNDAYAKSKTNYGVTDQRYNNLSTYNPSGYDKLSKDAYATQQKARATGDSGGVQDLVNQEYQTGGHSSGESMWSGALTQNEGADRFADLRNKFGNLSQYISDQNDLSAGKADVARNTTEQSKQQYADLYASKQAQEDAEAARQKAAKKKSDDTFALDQARALGYKGSDPEEARKYYNEWMSVTPRKTNKI